MQLNVGTIQGNSPNFTVTIRDEGTLEMESDLRILGQTYIPLPAGTTSQRTGEAVTGSIRFNTDSNVLECWTGASWLSL